VTITKDDLKFLRDLKIDVPDDEHIPENLTTDQLMDAALKTVQQMSPEQKEELRERLDAAIQAGATPLDGTEKMLLELGLPLTRENYLRLAFGGKMPEEPLDGEIETELPENFQIPDEDDDKA
jgi:hypothetical protein